MCVPKTCISLRDTERRDEEDAPVRSQWAEEDLHHFLFLSSSGSSRREEGRKRGKTKKTKKKEKKKLAAEAVPPQLQLEVGNSIAKGRVEREREGRDDLFLRPPTTHHFLCFALLCFSSRAPASFSTHQPPLLPLSSPSHPTATPQSLFLSYSKSPLSFSLTLYFYRSLAIVPSLLLLPPPSLALPIPPSLSLHLPFSLSVCLSVCLFLQLGFPASSSAVLEPASHRFLNASVLLVSWVFFIVYSRRIRILPARFEDMVKRKRRCSRVLK